MTFQPLAFIDASQATAAYTKQFKARLKASDDGEVEAIQLMRNGQPLPILSEWKSAKILLSKVRNAAGPFLDGQALTLRSAAVVSLPPDRWWNWVKPEPGGPWAMLTLLPSPGAMLYSGCSAFMPPVGSLTMIGRGAPFSAVNVGPVPCVWLWVEAEMPDAVQLGTAG